MREFSRGMRQRLAIARAFIHSPSVLLLDEPFTSLDDRAIAVLQSLLAEAAKNGASIVMSTHQLREAMELATQVVLLERGQLVFAGPRSDEMLSDPGWVYSHYGDKEGYANQILTIALKDLRSELRGKEAINASLAFSVVVLLLLNFAFDPSADETQVFAGGLLWIVFAFAGVLIFNRSFARELPNDCLDALIAAPIPGRRCFWARPSRPSCWSSGSSWSACRSFRTSTTSDAAGDLPADRRHCARQLDNERGRRVLQPANHQYPAARTDAAGDLLPDPHTSAAGGHPITSSLLTTGQIGTGNEAWVRLLAGCGIIFTSLGVSLIDFILVT